MVLFLPYFIFIPFLSRVPMWVTLKCVVKYSCILVKYVVVIWMHICLYINHMALKISFCFLFLSLNNSIFGRWENILFCSVFLTFFFFWSMSHMYHLPLPTEGILETKLYVNRFLYGVSSLHNILFIFLVLLFYVNESYRICSPVTCSFFIYFHCCRICCCMTIQLIYLSTISGHLNLSLFLLFWTMTLCTFLTMFPCATNQEFI